MNIVEKHVSQGKYGSDCIQAVIDHPAHGRILITNGFGGMHTLAGGAMRWRHGVVYRLKKGDTLESLRDEKWSEHVSALEAVLAGHDDQRPILESLSAARIADAAGLR